jgi:uncharacterized membrane protein YqjE
MSTPRQLPDSKTEALAKATNGGGPLARPSDVSRLSTPELVVRIAHDAQDLVKTEIQLAKAELKTTAQRVTEMLSGMAVAAALLFGAYLTLVAAAVIGLSYVVELWAAPLIVGGALLVMGVVAALVAIRRRPRAPLERTVKSLKEDLALARHPGNEPGPRA